MVGRDFCFGEGRKAERLKGERRKGKYSNKHNWNLHRVTQSYTELNRGAQSYTEIRE